MVTPSSVALVVFCAGIVLAGAALTGGSLSRNGYAAKAARYDAKVLLGVFTTVAVVVLVVGTLTQGVRW